MRQPVPSAPASRGPVAGSAHRCARPWPVRQLLATLLALLLPLVDAAADEDRGLELLRQARQALDEGEPDAALLFVEQSRTELPFSARRALLHHLRADVLTRRATLYRNGALEPPLVPPPEDAGPDAQPTTIDAAAAALADLDAALESYQLALTDGGERGPARAGYDHRAHVNSGVLRHQLAEQVLAAAGVPLSAAGIPADADPGPLKQAIESQLPGLERARRDFLEALGLRPDDGASRESVEALTRRLDALHEMLERLEEMEQEQQDEQQDQDQQQDGEGEDGEDGDQGDQQGQGDGEPEEPEDDQGGEGDDPQDEPPPDQPSQQPPPPGEQPQLTAAQLADLLDQLEELEERAMQMDRQRRAAQHSAVEKDW